MQPAEQGQAAPPNNLGSILRYGFLMYLVYTYAFKSPTPVKSANGVVQPMLTNAIPYNSPLAVRVYFSWDAELSSAILASAELDSRNEGLAWSLDDLSYQQVGYFSEVNFGGVNLTVPVNHHLLNNGSLHAHVVVWANAKGVGKPLFNVSHGLTKYMPAPKQDTRHHLLGSDRKDISEDAGSAVAQTAGSIISYWTPTLHLAMVSDLTGYPSAAAIPPQFADYYRINQRGHSYYPILYFNEFWLMKEHMIPINETLSTLPLEMSFSLISLIKWTMYIQMTQSFTMQESMGAAEGEADVFKRMLLDTNPYLLAVTFAVSMLHMVFDMLAFKNDITFWKNNKSMEGLSKKTIFMNTICQAIIFLYLLDNETSWMILLSSGVGVLIEVWKIKKAVNVSYDPAARFLLKFEDKDSYTNTTKKYDDVAYEYMSYLLYPLVFGFSMYSLVVNTHKSWYSWIIGSLVGAVYTFGFIMMTPQLFINYKLQSVAHLPWRAFTYKALNTFIDDLFAFIIKMPTMHRLSCFRDDLIFFIYLYQRYIYRVDPKRRNEFGQSMVETIVSGGQPAVPAENAESRKSQ